MSGRILYRTFPAIRTAYGSSPFNHFAEVFYWIVEQELKTANISATVIHYLDDFLLLLDPGVIANL